MRFPSINPLTLGLLATVGVPTSLMAAVPTFTTFVIDEASNKAGGTVADIDNDGILDYATASAWYKYVNETTFIKYLFGRRTGSIGGFLGDVDGDGRPDYIGANVWLRHPGDPTGEWMSYEHGVNGTHDVHGADFNNDGRLDVYGLHSNGDVPLVFELNPGEVTTTFSRGWPDEVVFPAGSGTHSGSAAADLDGDGDLDMAIDLDRWFENTGDGLTWVQHDLPLPAEIPERSASAIVDVADLDGDGDIDIAVADHDAADIFWYRNNGNKTFSAIHLWDGLITCHGLRIGDLDNDGDMDIWAGDSGNRYGASRRGYQFVWWNNGSGIFTRTQVASNGSGHNVRLGDFDGDGDLDAIAKNWQGSRLNFYRNDLINGGTPPDPDNRAPVITAIAANPLGDPVMSVALAVTASDPDDDSLSYTWSATSTPVGANPQIASGEDPTVTLDRAGTYAFKVVVSDGSLSAEDSVSVTVDQVMTELEVSP